MGLRRTLMQYLRDSWLRYMVMKNMPSVLQKFIGYFVTGGLAAVVDAGGFGILHALGLAVLPAAVTSFVTAAVVNYQLSSRYVFNHKPTKAHFYKFFVVALIGLAVNVGITYWLVINTTLLPILAKVIAIGVAFFVNFLLNLLIVFKPKDSASV